VLCVTSSGIEMHHWPETNESLILRVKDPADAASWSDFLSIYRPVVVRMACGLGLQHADAYNLAQQVFLSVAKAIENWEPDSRQPPFRVWLSRITRNAIVNALTRRKPDAQGGSTSVQEMLRELPERNDETNQQLMGESRRETIRWATEEIQIKFTNDRTHQNGPCHVHLSILAVQRTNVGHHSIKLITFAALQKN
jgi:RNA polymerase sigma-70 factor (ECF subfamily)